MLKEDAKWFAVSLRIMGDSFDPTQLESLLGLVPDTIGIRGQPRVGKAGRTYAPYRTNLWSYREASDSEIGFDQQIRSLFARLGPRTSVLRQLAATDGLEVELFCGFGSGNGQGGDTILPDTLRLLVDAGVSLGLDLYPPDIDTSGAYIEGTP
jgi:hypothetical protein